MNKVKIGISAALAILILAVCGIIGCYIVDNHSQVLSWIKNEKIDATSNSIDSNNDFYPYTKEYFDLLNEEAISESEMIIYKVHTDYGDSTVNKSTYTSTNYELGDSINISDHTTIHEGFKWKYYSLTRGGDPITELKFKYGAVILYCVCEKLNPVNVNLHIASNRTLNTTLYDSYEYSTFIGDGKNAVINASTIRVKTSGCKFLGLTRNIDDYANYSSSLNNLKPNEDCYVVYQENFSDIYMTDFVTKDRKLNEVVTSFIYKISNLNSVVGSAKPREGTFIGWSLDENATEPIEINSDVIGKYSKLYAVYSEKVPSTIYIGGNDIVSGGFIVQYEDLKNTGLSEDGTKLIIGKQEFELYNLTFEGFLNMEGPTNGEPVKRIEKGGGRWITYFKYDNSRTERIRHTQLYAKTIPDNDEYFPIKNYIYCSDDSTYLDMLKNFDFSFNETLANKTFTGWSLTKNGKPSSMDSSGIPANRNLFAIFE